MTATDTPETNVSSTICRRSSRDRYCRTGFAGRLACSISLIHTLSGERPQPNPSERMHLTQTHTPDGLMSTLTLIVDELGFVPLSKTGAELLFEMLSQRYARGSTLITSNLPFQEWTEVLGSERLTGALLDRLTHHVHILEMNGDSFRLKQSRRKRSPANC